MAKQQIFARLDPGMPAHDALLLMVDTYIRRQKANGQLEKTTGPIAA